MTERVLSDHLCECGCGQRTYLATRTQRGDVRGQPYRYAPGHNSRTKQRPADPNPSGLCMCGCGQKAPIASQTASRYGHVAGKPTMYVLGHNAKPKAPIIDENGCWIWQGAPGSHGRGQTHLDGQVELAYRAYYREHIGPIPEGHHLHHICENPMCVNPAHLEPLTPAAHLARHREQRRSGAQV